MRVVLRQVATQQPFTTTCLASSGPLRLRTKRSFAAHANLSGTWVKDDEASESPESVCELFELNFVVRRAIGLVKTMEIVDDNSNFTTRLKALVLSIDERYAKSGEPAVYNRRDLRPGKLVGRYELTTEGHPSIRAEWEDPVKGQSVDVFKLSKDGQTLVQETTYVRHSNGKSSAYKTVHRRSLAA